MPEGLNLDFERTGPDPRAPVGWLFSGEGKPPNACWYEVTTDDTVAHSGRRSLRLRARRHERGRFGYASLVLPAGFAAGRRLQFSGWVRTESVTDGYAGLWCRVDGQVGRDQVTLALDNSRDRFEERRGAGREPELFDRGLRGTNSWTRRQIDIDVDGRATAIYFGTILNGLGTAWFDDLSLEVDGIPYAPAAADLDRVQRRGIPLRHATLGDESSRLAHLLGDARVVALGAAAYGTAELTAVRRQLTETLVGQAQSGFSMVVIDAGMAEVAPLDRYIHTGEGDPVALLKGLGRWSWADREALDLVDWLRGFNQSNRGWVVRLFGFDYDRPRAAADAVRRFVAEADPGYVAELERAYAGLDTFDALEALQRPWWLGPAAPGLTAGERRRLIAQAEALRQRVEAIGARLEADRARLERVRSAAEVEQAIRHARLVVQAVTGLTAGPEERAAFLAENLEWALAQAPPGARAVVWAHNAQVARAPGTLGGRLAARHGDELLVLGSAFHAGRYRAVHRGGGLGVHEAATSTPGSVEWLLHQDGRPAFILDLRGAPGLLQGPTGSGRTLLHRNLGPLALEHGFEPADVADDYDGLIFLHSVAPATPLPSD
jgi:erythromycin esterase